MISLEKPEVAPAVNATTPQRRPRYVTRLIGGRDEATFTATAVKALPADDNGKGIVRLHNSRIDRARSNPAKLFRRETVKIVNVDNPKLWVLAQAMGTGASVEGVKADTVCLDYDQRDALGLRSLEGVKLEVRRPSEWDVWAAGWDSPNPLERANTRLAVIGFVLGVLGLFTAFL